MLKVSDAALGSEDHDDGSFYVSVVASQRPLRTAELKGKIVGGKLLEADIGTSLCAAHLSLTKS